MLIHEFAIVTTDVLVIVIMYKKNIDSVVDMIWVWTYIDKNVLVMVLFAIAWTIWCCSSSNIHSQNISFLRKLKFQSHRSDLFMYPQDISAFKW